MKKIDGVFAGGGIKSFAFVGAIRELKRKDIQLVRVAGTSAGALTAALLKAGYSSEEMEALFDEVNFDQLLEPKKYPVFSSFYRWIRLYKTMGIYRGKIFEDWLFEALKQKGIMTFGDLEAGSLKMIASDLTTGQIIVLPDDLEKYGYIPEKFSVARAVRMSCSLPFFFEPVKLINSIGEESVVVDGGVLSNFPIWLFADSSMERLKRPVLGFRLSPSTDNIAPIEVDNAIQMLQSLFDTMQKAHDQRYISKKFSKNIVFIPTKDYPSSKFTITEDEKINLITLGEKTTAQFLRTWSY